MLGVHSKILFEFIRTGLQRASVGTLLGLIRAYQLTLSPFIGNQCRFHPTCSVYARDALIHHGLRRGGWLAIQRLARCHPFNPGGVDLVPQCERLMNTEHEKEGAETFKVKRAQC